MKSARGQDEQLAVGPRLRRFREEAGLTKQELAAHMNYSLSGIKKMELPEANPTVKSMELYLRACGRTLGELFRSMNQRKTA